MAVSGMLKSALLDAELLSQLTNPDQSRLVVGYSGGVDSHVLLAHLCELGLRNKLLAFHVNHGLSPHANAWQTHCQKICQHENCLDLLMNSLLLLGRSCWESVLLVRVTLLHQAGCHPDNCLLPAMGYVLLHNLCRQKMRFLRVQVESHHIPLPVPFFLVIQLLPSGLFPQCGITGGNRSEEQWMQAETWTQRLIG